MHKLSFPEDWEMIPLENAVNIFDKQRIPLNEAHRQQIQGEYPYCGANGVVDYVNDYLFDGEHILLAEDGGYWGSFEESAYLMNGKFWVNNHAHVLQAMQGLSDNYFLMCQLNYLDIKPFISGTTRGKLNQGMMKRVPLALPSLPEQRAIANILQTIQEAKFTRQHEIALERERKAALMDYLFSHGTKGEPRKQTEIGKIPERWEVVKLDNLCELIQYGTSKRCNVDRSGVPVLRIPNIVGGKVDISELKFAEFNQSEFQSLSLEVGDLLFVRTNGKKEYAGRCAVYQNEIQESLFASYLIRVRVKSDTVLPEFVQLYTMTSKGRSYLSGRASIAADGKFNINTQTIKSVLLPFPVPPEQREITETCCALDTKTAALEREVELIDELFHAMLDELMTGKRSAIPLIDAEKHV